MNKTELISAVAKEANITKTETEIIINTLTDVIQNEVAKGEKVQVTGFGTFERKERGAREVKNPRTGESVQVAASKYPSFSAGAVFKEKVNK
jgi:DNA-binding protein HU-beta